MRAFTMICQRTWCSLIVHVLELIGVCRQVEELVHIHGRETILRGDLRRRAYVLVLRVLVVPSADRRIRRVDPDIGVRVVVQRTNCGCQPDVTWERNLGCLGRKVARSLRRIGRRSRAPAFTLETMHD